MARLGDVCTIYTGTGFPVQYQGSAEGQYPFYKVGDIAKNVTAGNKYLNFCENYVDPDVVKKIKGTVLPSRTVVFAKIGEAVKLNRRAITSCECLIDNNAMGIAPNESVLTLDYFFHYMCQLRLETLAEATTVPSVKKSIVENLDIPVPSIVEQQVISKTLNKVSELIALRKEQLAKLDQLVKSRFIELFDGKYETKPLALVCEELFAGGDVKKDKSSDTQSEKYPYPIYTNGEKDNGLYGYTSIIRVAKEAVTISGRGTIGFTCLRKEPFYPAVRLIVAVPKQELISGCYLQHFIQNKNYGGQGASIPQLTVPMIKDEPIPVPPMELQEQFAAFVEQTDKSKLAIQQSLDKLELLKKSLMQEYFG